MAFSIGGLIQNIQNSVSSLFSSPSKANPGLYPELNKEILNNIDPSNWTKSLPYSFAVIDAVTGNPISGFSEFKLPINPSDITQDETPSVIVRPSAGGTIIRHDGVRYKELQISGTTGVAPFRGAGGADKNTGRAILAPDNLQSRSGFEVFLLLRNWFKAFHDGKTHHRFANWQLVFRNYKDGESLVVELLKFTMKRSASRATLYDYQINLKVLGTVQTPKPEDGLLNEIDSYLDKAATEINKARGIMLRSQDILRQVNLTYNNSVLEPLRMAILTVGAAKTVADMGPGIVSRTISETATLSTLLAMSALSTLLPSDQARIKKAINNAQTASRIGESSTVVANAIPNLFDSDLLMRVDKSVMPVASQNALAEEIAQAANLPRAYFENALTTITSVRDDLADRLGLGNATYNNLVGRVSTSTGATTPTDAELLVLGAFSSAIRGLKKIIASNQFKGETYADILKGVQSHFSGDLGLVPEPTMREIVLPVDTDLERIALQELGDSGRWVEIAELNDLKPPYIVQDQSDKTPNVAHPSQILLIPQPITNGLPTIVDGKPTYFSENLSEVEKNLGVDFLLSSEFDLVLGNGNDFEVAFGAANAAQAIALKLRYEPGDLLKHPQLGTGLVIGSKMPDVNTIQANLVRTLSQDSRFQSVTNISIQQIGDELDLSFNVILKNVDVPIPIRLRV